MRFLKLSLRIIINICIFLVFFIPFYWMILTSLKTLGQTLKMPPTFFVQEPQYSNFLQVFKNIPFFNMLKNSVIITTGIILAQIITVIPSAYAFARFRFKGKDILFGTTLLTMMIPSQLIFLPVFLMFSKFGMVNSYISLILPSACSAFSIFMLRQNFKQVPEELLEAARLDKANEWKILTKIMLPIAKPTVVTMLLITFINSWNDYFWPLVLTTNNNIRPLTVGISSLREVEGGISYQILMAGNVLLIVPIIIVFLFAQKHIIKAFTYMGEK